MELNQQVCSLESAKCLKELGVKQESLFYWHETARLDGINNINQSKINSKYCYSAFTVAELGEMLRECPQLNWCDLYTGDLIFQPTEAEARAKMLIYLLENKLI